MKNITLIVLMIFCLNAFSQKTTDSLELWTLFTIGNLVNSKAHEFAAQGLPIKIIHKTGDVFWETYDEDAEFKSEIEYIKGHNDSVWTALEKQGFEFPEERYKENFQIERTNLELALKLFNESPLIKTYHENRRRNRFPNADVKKFAAGVYEIAVGSFDVENPVNTYKHEFLGKIDIKTRQTTIQKL